MKPNPIQHAIDQFSRLPGVGERTALRLVLHLVSNDREALLGLGQALDALSTQVRECSTCHMVTTECNQCSVCSSTSRDKKVLCVVSRVQDLMALERTAEYRGLYHVLHGVLAPMEGIGPSKLRIQSLLNRLLKEEVEEVILATPATVEGEATALFLFQELSERSFNVTRIATGVPVGGELQFADRMSLSRALALRRHF
ncbi:MAG: recombination protein RecR [Myxococcaceae bacterium]|nr:recombination protein RecR [Myxococcaceae bacterium]MBH2006183.1 recombination protein RecR [Myxococcaceae bacterium]